MKNLFCNLFCLMLTFQLFSQGYREIEQNMTVVAFKGLNIRNSPTQNGKVLASVPFGGVVIPLENSDNLSYDTIGHIAGQWIKVKYKKVEGFAFSPYLVENLTIDRVKSDGDMLILMEGLPGYFTAYEPDFHYYGLYKYNDSLRWEKIKVSFLVAAVDGYERFTNETFTNNYCLDDFPNIKIITDRNQESELIIGSRKELEEDKIKSLFQNETMPDGTRSGYLHPEQIISIEYNGAKYNFRAFDSISIDYKSKTFQTYYQLQFYLGNKFRYDYNNLQNISYDLELYGSGQIHTFYKTPILKWIGDINGDGIIDAIFYQFGMVEHGGTHWEYTLFLGKRINGDLKLIKEWSYLIGSCV